MRGPTLTPITSTSENLHNLNNAHGLSSNVLSESYFRSNNDSAQANTRQIRNTESSNTTLNNAFSDLVFFYTHLYTDIIYIYGQK